MSNLINHIVRKITNNWGSQNWELHRYGETAIELSSDENIYQWMTKNKLCDDVQVFIESFLNSKHIELWQVSLDTIYGLGFARIIYFFDYDSIHTKTWKPGVLMTRGDGIDVIISDTNDRLLFIRYMQEIFVNYVPTPADIILLNKCKKFFIPVPEFELTI